MPYSFVEKFNQYLKASSNDVVSEQFIFKFPNNYGASVVKGMFSIGHEFGLWELAIIKWIDNDNFDIVYDTPITNDVIGWLTADDVITHMEQIKDL